MVFKEHRCYFSTSDLTFVYFSPQNKRSTFWLTEKSQVLAWDRGWNKILFFRYCNPTKKKNTHTHTRVFVIMLLIKCLLAARIWWSIIHFIIHPFILWRSASWFWLWKTLSLKWESIKLWTMSWIKRMVFSFFLLSMLLFSYSLHLFSSYRLSCKALKI